jgi:hypothetical protein
MNGRWSPLAARPRSVRDVAPGELIAYDFSAWRALSVEPADEGEYRIEVERQHGDSDIDRGAIVTRRFARVDVYDSPRIPLCSCCDNPYPCRLQEAERIAAASGDLMRQRMQRAEIPGTCYACGEPITTKQGSITYPAAEGNVHLPGYPAPRFHTRNNCWEGRFIYARDRAAAMPDQMQFDQEVQL